jgi:hypothetical protein
MQGQLKSVLVLVFATAMLAGASTAPGDELGAEDLAILNAVLAEDCSFNGPLTVVTDLPASPHEVDVPNAAPKDVRFGLDLATRQPGSTRWPLGELCPTVLVAADERIKETFARETKIPPSGEFFMKEFNQPRFLAGVSLPVYSTDGKRAVVYTWHRCGGLCGAGFYLELKKTSEGWKKTNSAGAWIS